MEFARRLFDRVRNFLPSLLLFFFWLVFFYSRGGEKNLISCFLVQSTVCKLFFHFRGHVLEVFNK